MTPLNTIIEEEKKKLEDTAGYNYNLYLAGTVRRADTGEDWTFEQAEKELKNFLTTAMQRAYDAGKEERDTYWKERVRKVHEEELERMKKIHAQVVEQVKSNTELREAVGQLLKYKTDGF